MSVTYPTNVVKKILTWCQQQSHTVRSKIKEDDMWKLSTTYVLDNIRSLPSDHAHIILQACIVSDSMIVRKLRREEKLFHRLLDRIEIPTESNTLWELYQLLDKGRLFISCPKVRELFHKLAQDIYNGNHDHHLTELSEILIRHQEDMDIQDIMPTLLHVIKARILEKPGLIEPAIICKLWSWVRLRDAPFLNTVAGHYVSQSPTIAEAFSRLDIPTLSTLPKEPWYLGFWLNIVSPYNPSEVQQMILHYDSMQRIPENIKKQKNSNNKKGYFQHASTRVENRIKTGCRIANLFYSLDTFQLTAIRAFHRIILEECNEIVNAEAKKYIQSSGIHSDVCKVLSIVQPHIPRQEVSVRGTYYDIDIVLDVQNK